MTNYETAFVGVVGDDANRGAIGERVVQVDKATVDLAYNGRFGQLAPDCSCQITRSGSGRQLFFGTIRKPNCDLGPARGACRCIDGHAQ